MTGRRRPSIGFEVRQVLLTLGIAALGCSDDASTRAGRCTWRIEYSSHELVDEPPRPSRIGSVMLAGDDVVHVGFVDASGAAGELENFDGAEIELSAAGSAKLATLYGAAWEADAPLAGQAILRLEDAGGDLARFRLVVGHPAPIRILHSEDRVVLRMPLVEGSLAKLPQGMREACK
jgi:hypothetical protein